MDVDRSAARVAAAIGEPARARMLFSLMDNHARTGTELATVAEISPSTASVHLNRLTEARLVKVLVQGRHRYYSLESPAVAAALEALSVLGGGSRARFTPNTPDRLRAARTCYDHMAGSLGVALHDGLRRMDWLSDDYDIMPAGIEGFEGLGIDVAGARASRRRFTYGCLDWSERRSHLGGAMGAALLKMAVKKRWVLEEPHDRALSVTTLGKREFRNRFGIAV